MGPETETDDSGPVRVPLSAIDTIALLRQSIERTDQMRRGNPSYGGTSLEMNDVGLLGEHAVRHFLAARTEYVEAVADTVNSTRYGGGDVAVSIYAGDPSSALKYGRSVEVEVKTSRFRDWRRIGRALNSKQLAHMRSMAIVWCVVADELPTESVIIMGWLPTIEVRGASSNKSVVLRGQACVKVEMPMRSPAALVPWIHEQETPHF